MMILYFDKELQQFKNLKKENQKVTSLVGIIVRNWTYFNKKNVLTVLSQMILL